MMMTMIFILCVERHLSPFTNIAVWGQDFIYLPIVFPVQVWQWRILTIIKETQCVKSNIINFYIFVIQIILTKETLSLCYLVIFFGFHLHYLNLNVIDLQLVAPKAFYIVLFFKSLRCQKTVLLPFLSPWDFTWMVRRLQWKFWFRLSFLAWC